MEDVQCVFLFYNCDEKKAGLRGVKFHQNTYIRFVDSKNLTLIFVCCEILNLYSKLEIY